MSRVNRLTGGMVAGCVVFFGAGLGSIQAQERVQRRVEKRVTVERGSLAPRKARSILGAKVSIRGDYGIGTVDDIIFTDDGYIDYLVVLNRGKYVLVPWDAAKFNYEHRTAVVDIPQERYREIPTFTQESWPNVYETKYRERVYGYYGLKPRVERRVERREGRR